MERMFFQNSKWNLYIGGNTVRAVSRDGKGTGYAKIRGTPYEYDRMSLENRGPRVVYSGIRLPVYIRAKMSGMLTQRGARAR